MATRMLVTYALVVTAVLVVSFLRDAGALQKPLALGALTPGDAPAPRCSPGAGRP